MDKLNEEEYMKRHDLEVKELTELIKKKEQEQKDAEDGLKKIEDDF